MDEQKENDVLGETKGVKFVMEKEIFDKYGDIKIESVGLSLKISPVNKAHYEGCSCCGGSCG